jgi:predicted short-subunit dehydrogenase-like oxidoreductase (DUF2520 family)
LRKRNRVKPSHRMRPRSAPGKLDLTIVGPGRVGQAMAKLLAGAGIKVRFVAARRLEAARRAVRFIGAGTPVALGSRELAEASVILLTVSDSALAPLARQLSSLRSSWRGKVVLHTCGALPSNVLAPLKRRGAAIGSLHPFQTIPDPATGSRNLLCSFWAIEGDARACQVARRLCRALEGISFHVRPSWKTLYHAAAFLSCAGVVTLLDQSARLLRSAGVPERIVRPMLGQFVNETIGNFVRLGARRALTGPAVRGDWETIDRHLRALRRSAPELLEVYQPLVRAMVRLARRRQPPHLSRKR